MEEIYLDYSATTKVDQQVLDYFNLIVNKYYANPNSSHDLGYASFREINKSIKNICNFFNIFDDEIIFTSGATESNNTVLKGIINGSRNEIITTRLEHSSIYGPISQLQDDGYKILFVDLDSNGCVNLNSLKKLINDKTLLVSIGAVNSEMGIRQPIEEIGNILSEYKDIYFHSDITQCLGKCNIDLSNVDLVSFSGHKIFCFKGIGGLIKKRSVKLKPLLNGGKSTTIYRSGTPQTELICSLSKAIDLFKSNIDCNYKYVLELNEMIRNHIKKYKNIKLNSTDKSIPYIINLSILGIDSLKIQEFFNKNKIYISTQTACSSNNSYSLGVYNVTNDMERAKSSFRVSLSYKTSIEEIKEFLRVLDLFMGDEYEIN